MNNIMISNQALVFSGALVLIAIFVGYKEKLGINKSIVISISRAIVQLCLIGYLLKYVFQLDNTLYTILMILFICLNASYNASKRSCGIPKSFIISLGSIISATTITLSVLLIAGTIHFIPSQIIPISGMIAGNAMVAIGLCYRHLNEKYRDQQQGVLERLALGATPSQASVSIVRSAIKMALQPTIDSAKTVGLVSLPGMMSGLIFAGVDPVKAIRYQIMVVFMLLATTSIAIFIACHFAYRQYFNTKVQLIISDKGLGK